MKISLCIFIAILTLTFSVASQPVAAQTLAPPYISNGCLTAYNTSIASWRSVCVQECNSAVDRLSISSYDKESEKESYCLPLEGGSVSSKELAIKRCISAGTNASHCTNLINLTYENRLTNCTNDDLKITAENACRTDANIITQSLTTYKEQNAGSCPDRDTLFNQIGKNCINATNRCMAHCAEAVSVNGLNDISVKLDQSEVGSYTTLCDQLRVNFQNWLQVGGEGNNAFHTTMSSCTNDNLVDKPGDEDPGDVTPFASAPDDDSEVADTKKPSTTDKIMSGLKSMGDLGQMAMPFLTSGTPSELAYNYNNNYPNTQIDTNYPQQPFDYPADLTAPGDDPFSEPDIPNLEDPNALPKTSGGDSAQGNNMNNGMMGGGGMMPMPNNGAGGGPPRRRGRGRPVSKGNKSLYSNRLQNPGSESPFANPSKTTAGATRTQGFDKNGRPVDQRFNPDKYQLKIQSTYNNAINSKAMQAAMRRAAGYEATVSTSASQGYSNWHKKYNIHPGRLSIFKQVRVCYIIKYSNYSGDCGPANPN